MNHEANTRTLVLNVIRAVTAMFFATVVTATSAQVPVDDTGQVIGHYEPALENSNADLVVGNEDIPLMSGVDLEVLVGPIALYPDDLLAIVLPASAYPLQLIDAARFLEELENDPSLQPDPEWDDSIVALLNYPEVIELLNDDIDWTWRLGEAVVAQQGDVVAAIEVFRDRAYAAGNLKSDSYQNVTRDAGVIEITPVVEDVIYVPYYEPERVVVYQPRPVYYYYPRSYPVYYYPYTAAHHFDRGFFWGVTTAFTIGWMSDSLHVYHHSYHGHPYYGRSYRDRWWYRRPTVNVYNTTYVRNTDVTINRYFNGDRWQPRQDRRQYTRHDSSQEARLARSRNYKRRVTEPATYTQTARRQEPIQFRERPGRRGDANQQVVTEYKQREQRAAPRPRQAQESRTPVRQARPDTRTRPAPQTQARLQARERPAPQAQARQQARERPAPQAQARQQVREQPAPQARARQQARERPAPQAQASQQARGRPAPQAQARQQARERAAPERREKSEVRSEPRGSEKRQDGSSSRANRKARR